MLATSYANFCLINDTSSLEAQTIGNDSNIVYSSKMIDLIYRLAMPLNSRPTTTSNVHSQKALPVPAPIDSTVDYDDEYFEAIKLIERTRKLPLVKNDGDLNVKEPHRRPRFSSGLSDHGQEAMLKTYEDTLITHLADLYSSKHIAAILPRSQQPELADEQRLESIRTAQNLIDRIHRRSTSKQELLCEYVQWQEKLKNPSSIC